MPAITPRYSVDNVQHSTNSTAEIWTGDLSGGAIIPAVDLPAGGDFLVAHSMSFGCSLATGAPLVACVYGRGAVDLSFGGGAGFVTASPESMRTSHLAGFNRLSTDGTKDIEFAFKSRSSSYTTFVQGATILALQLNESGKVLLEGTDFFQADQFGNVQLTSTYATLLTMSAGVATPGDYLLLACATANGFTPSIGEQRKLKLTINGFLHKHEWVKQVKNVNDWNQMTVVSRMTLSAGTHSFVIQGGGTGTGTKYFYNANMFLFRVGAFRSIVESGFIGSAAIGSEYPSYTQVNSAAFTNSGSEPVIILGNQFGRRTSLGAIAARLKNTTSDTVLHEFCADNNVSGIDQDETTELVIGSETLAAPATYALEATGETGKGTSGLTAYYPNVVAWSTTLATAGPDHDVTITEATPIFISGDTVDVPMVTVGITESDTTLGPDSAYVPGEGPIVVNITESDIVLSDNVVPTSSATVPTAHPRTWFYNNARQAYIQARIGSTLATRYTAFNNSSSTQSWGYNKALKFLISGDPADANAAVAILQADLDDWTIGKYIKGGVSPNGARGGSDNSCLYWLDRTRDWACTYDWLKPYGYITAQMEARLKNAMLAGLYCIFNPSNTVGQGHAGPDQGTNNGWAINSAGNNYYSRKMLGAAYVILTWFHEGMSSFTYSETGDHWTGGETFNLTLTYSGVTYTNPWEWFQAKLEGQSIPEWLVQADGGAWHEGSNYGRSALRHQMELQILLRDSGARDYTASLGDGYQETALYEIFAQQPGSAAAGNRQMVFYGDTPGSTQTLGVLDFDRHLVLLARELWPNIAASYYAQWLLANQWRVDEDGNDFMGYTDAQLRGPELMLYKPDATAVDYRTPLVPIHYYAPGTGFVTARNGWADTDTCISFRSGNWKDAGDDHIHEEMNGLQIFRGTWLLRDNAYGNQSGSFWSDPSYHNTYTLAGWGQAARSANTIAPMGRILREIGADDYSYALGDCGDAYYVKSSGSHVATAITKINDIYTREMFYHRSTGFVVLYDRVRFLPAFASGPATGYLQYPSQPTDLGSGIGRIVSGSNAIVRKIVSTVNSFTSAAFNTAWRESYQLPLVNRYGSALILHQVGAAASLPTMTAHTEILSSSANMRGVHVQDATEEFLVLFSTAQDAAAPSNVDYSYTESAQDCLSHVCNLSPNTGYDIVSNLVSTTRNVTVLLGGQYFSNAAGILSFNAADLSAPPTFRTITETPLLVDNDTLDVSATVPFTEADITLSDSVQAFFYPGTSDTETITESALAVTDSIDIYATVPLTESATVLSGDSVAVTSTVQESDTVSMGADTVQVTVFGPTIPPPPPGVEDTGNRIDTRVQMDTSIDRGPSWQ